MELINDFWYNRKGSDTYLGHLSVNEAALKAKVLLEEDVRAEQDTKKSCGHAYAKVVSISGFVACELVAGWSFSDDISVSIYQQ